MIDLLGASKQSLVSTPEQDDKMSSPFNQSFSHSRRALALVDDESFYKLRYFEMLFNEIAMAHNSDEKQLEQSIKVYKEKYNKSNYMFNLLFDNLETTLNVNLNFDWL